MRFFWVGRARRAGDVDSLGCNGQCGQAGKAISVRMYAFRASAPLQLLQLSLTDTYAHAHCSVPRNRRLCLLRMWEHAWGALRATVSSSRLVMQVEGGADASLLTAQCTASPTPAASARLRSLLSFTADLAPEQLTSE